MKVKVYMKGKNDKPIFSCMFSEKQKAKESDTLFVERVLKEHEEELFDEPLFFSGITNIKMFDDMKSSFRKDNGEIEWGTKPVSLGDSQHHKDTKTFLGVDIVSEGWCLKVVRESGDTRYFYKINRRTVNTIESVTSAKIYQSINDLKREVENKRNTLIACVSGLGWSISLAAASEEFEKEYSLSKHSKKEEKTLEEVKTMIENINSEGVARRRN